MTPTSLHRWRKKFLLLSLTTFLSSIGSSFSSVQNSCSPDGDIFLEEGSALELYCYVDATRQDFAINNAFSIVFYHKNEERVRGQFVSILNDTTARLYMENVLDSDQYSCKLIVMNDNEGMQPGEEEDSPIFREELLCTYKVVVGRKPSPLENFSCLSYNWDTLNCSWTPVKNDIQTTYEIGYMLPSRSGKNTSYSCPQDDDVQFNRCTWTLDTDPPYRRAFKFFTFVITGHNMLGDMTQKIAFYHYSRLVASPPQELSVVNKTRSSVYLKWSIGVFCVFDDGIRYKISYAKESTPTNNTIRYYEGEEMDRFRDEVAYNVTDLLPGTTYLIKVFMKVATAEEELWSLPSSITVKTNSS